MITSVALLKSQLNLTGTDDDALLAHKIAAAEQWIADQIGVELVTLDPLPATITEAILQLAAHWFEQREAVLIGINSNEVPFGVREIIGSYRVWEI